MNEWMPGAERVAGAHQGGTLIGGPSRCTWHITWDRLDPRPSFEGVRDYLVRMNYEPTLMWDPETGRVAQFLPASHSAYAVLNQAGGVETNRIGDVHVQIEVFFSPGYKDRKLFTDGPLVGLEQIMSWLDELGIPRAAAGDWSHPTRDLTIWRTHPGHFGHFQVPENDHSDPIAGTDIARILAAGATPAPSPSPHPSEDDMGSAIVYDNLLDDFSVNTAGELVVRYYSPDSKKWTAGVLGGGCTPGAPVSIVRDYGGTTGRVDLFVDAPNGRGHAVYEPGGDWAFQILG